MWDFWRWKVICFKVKLPSLFFSSASDTSQTRSQNNNLGVLGPQHHVCFCSEWIAVLTVLCNLSHCIQQKQQIKIYNPTVWMWPACLRIYTLFTSFCLLLYLYKITWYLRFFSQTQRSNFVRMRSRFESTHIFNTYPKKNKWVYWEITIFLICEWML